MMKLRQIAEIQNPKPTTESHTCFVSLVPADGGGYHAAYREFTPFSATLHRSDVYSCTVRYQKYDEDLNPVGDSHLLRKLLQDPRCFIWKGRPYTLCVDDTTKGFCMFTNVVVDMTTGESRDLRTFLDYDGKNWMPVPDGDRLYFIRSIDPLCILECNDKWECRTIIEPRLGHHAIGVRRGGCAASIKDGIISGVGRLTKWNAAGSASPFSHTPFTYKISMADGVVTDIRDATPEGFAEIILDPTSVIDKGIVLACSVRQWHHMDQISTRLCGVSDD